MRISLISRRYKINGNIALCVHILNVRAHSETLLSSGLLKNPAASRYPLSRYLNTLKLEGTGFVSCHR